ncbi:MAG: acetate--CoA ligase family protein [Burkholderiaceae bacterium]|nr:acetate--CoA ligase family protein [Burkholderiaceae bacterium]
MSPAPEAAHRLRCAQALLAPQCVAIIGASGDAAKNTARPQRYLRQHGYAGRVVLVNASRSELFGERAWPSLTQAPGPVDHAFVMVPAADVEAAVADCVAKDVPLISIYSDGFAETGAAGLALQRRIADIARAGGSRVIGPNSVGTVIPGRGVTLSVNAVLDLPALLPGRLGLVSQSGSLIGAILSRGQARGIGFSALVSIGNECDLSVGDVTDWLADDPQTDAILLFLETLRDARRLAQASRRAAATGKPLVAYVLGHSEAGRELAVTHTGALMGDADAMNAWLDANGIVRIDHFETLLEIVPALRQARPPAGRRVAVVTTTGGGAAMVVDRIDSAEIELVGPPPAMIEAFAAQGVRIGPGAVTDLTMAGTKRGIYGSVLDAYLASEHCDTVLAIAGSSAQFHPQLAVQPIASAQRHGKSLLAFATPQADEALKLFAQAGVPAFRTPESCADALRALARWREPQPIALPDAAETTALAAAAAQLQACGREACDEAQAREVFAALGIAQGDWHVLRDARGGAVSPLPAAVKVLSPDLPHKSDFGAVRLGCASQAELLSAVADVIAAARRHAPAARIGGALVQRMEHGIVEAILGFRHDPQVGPTVMVGMGGVQAEIYRDVAVRPAPVSLAEAARMVDGVPGLALLDGWRGGAKGDRHALVCAIRALSLLACLDNAPVAEAEINPLLVRTEGQGVVALDALLVLKPPELAT